MNKKLTFWRLVVAIATMPAELVAIWVVWRWLLPALGVDLGSWVVIVAMSGWFVFGIWLFIFTTRTLEKQAKVAASSMIGSVGKAVGRLAPEGMVKIKGEFWKATAESGVIESGESITVTGEDGLQLVVRKTS